MLAESEFIAVDDLFDFSLRYHFVNAGMRFDQLSKQTIGIVSKVSQMNSKKKNDVNLIQTCFDCDFQKLPKIDQRHRTLLHDKHTHTHTTQK
jgi:hypothetical protein